MKPIRNIHGEPVPTIGGITSRDLFRPLFGEGHDNTWKARQVLPNTLWLATSIALIALGVLLL